MMFKHCNLNGAGVQLGAAHHQRRGNRMRDQMFALLTGQAVVRVGPHRVHIEHAHIVQQRGGGQRHAFTLGPAVLERQINGHQRHLHAVLIKVVALLAHDRELEGNGLWQQHAFERRQQAIGIAQRRRHAGQQLLLLALLACQFQQRSVVDEITSQQIGINRVPQFVHDQTVIEAVVYTCPFIHQLHTFICIDCVTRHHLGMLGHIRHGAQKMQVLAVLGFTHDLTHQCAQLLSIHFNAIVADRSNLKILIHKYLGQFLMAQNADKKRTAAAVLL